jgi:hypothetical protein
MGVLAVLPAIGLMTHVVLQDRSPLLDRCAPEGRVVAYLDRGDPIAIQFAVAGENGTCYKVAATRRDEAHLGYVSAAAVSGVEEFERSRREAPSLVTQAGSEIVRAGSAMNEGGAGPAAARLIQANKPAEALELLETSLRVNGKDAGLLSLAGYAAYRNDEPRRAIDYWRASLAIHSNPAVERLYQLAEREAREDQSGEKLVGARFLLRYNRGQMDSATARDLVTLLDREFARISSELGCEATERIVAIVQTPEEYRRTTEAAEWSGGQYNGRIRVAAPDQRRLGEELARTFSHEIVHACMAGLGDFPQWLHEGLAQRLSGETLDPAELAEVKRQARAGQLPRLENMSQTWARLSASHAKVAYSTALAATELFFENQSALGPRNLLRNPQLLSQVAAELDRRLRE